MNKKKLPLMVFLALVMSVMIPLTLTFSSASASVADSAGYKKYDRVTTETLQNGDNICFGRRFAWFKGMEEQKYGLISPNYMIDDATGMSQEGVPFESASFEIGIDPATGPKKVVEKIVNKYTYTVETANSSGGFYIKFKDSGVTNTEEYCYLNVMQSIAHRRNFDSSIGGFVGAAFATRPMVSYTLKRDKAAVFYQKGDLICVDYATNITGIGVPINFAGAGISPEDQVKLRSVAKTDTPCFLGSEGARYVVSYEEPELPQGTTLTNQTMTLCATNNQDLIAILNYPQNKQVTQKQIYGSLGTGLSVVANIAAEKNTVNQYDPQVDGSITNYSVIARQVAKIDIFREAAKHIVHMNKTENGTFTLESDGNAVTSLFSVDFTVYHNSDVKFTFTPNSSYMFAECKLDGESVANGASVNITRDRVGVTTFDTIPRFTMSVDKNIVELTNIAATDKDANIREEAKLGNITITNTGNRDIWFNGKQDFEFVKLYLPPLNDKIAPNSTRTVDIGINANAVPGLNEKKIIVPNENGQSVEFTVKIELTSKMSIDKESLDFGSMEYTYTPISQDITITNNGLEAFTIELSPQLVNFTISGNIEKEILTGKSLTLSVIPKSNLEARKKAYEESITITSTIGDEIIVPLKFKVTRKVVASPKIFVSKVPVPESEYNGEAQILGLEGLDTTYYTAIISLWDNGASVEAINAGTYSIRVSLKEPTRYQWDADVADVRYTHRRILKNKHNGWITAPTSMNNYAAGTTPVLPKAEAKYGEVEYRYYSGDKLLDAAPTTVGQYKLKVIVPDNNNFNSVEKNFNFEVTDYAVVTFYVDGVRYGAAQHVALGGSAVKPEDPTKENVGETYYTFSKWDKTFDNIQGYTDIHAVFTEEIKHTTPIKVERLEPTCTADGHKEYWKCGTCDKIYSDAAGLTETNSAEITLVKTHKTNLVPRVEPTCTVDGNKEYWTCSGCDKIFSDAEGTTIITLEDTKIPKRHTLILEAYVASTCTETGHIQRWKCEVCEKYFSDEAAAHEIDVEHTIIGKIAHTLTHVPVLAATCTAAGRHEHWTCSVCKKYFSDSAGKNVIEYTATVIDKIAHRHDETWHKDEVNHWHKCADCQEVMDTAAHIWDNGVITTPPTAESVGVKTYTCLCGATKTEEITIIPPTDIEIHDSENKISVLGKITEGAKLEVSSIKDVDIFKKLQDSIGVSNEEIGDYFLSMTGGAFSGNLTITFTLDSKYNGKTIMILQQKVGGQIELFSAVAENGKVSITVTELSSFMLASPKDSVVDLAGCKSTMGGAGSALLVISSAIFLAIIAKRKKLGER